MTRIKKEPKCSICRRVPKPDCDYHQGRCPHRPSMLDQISTPIKTRFFNLLNFFKGKNEQPSRSSKTPKHKSSKKRT